MTEGKVELKRRAIKIIIEKQKQTIMVTCLKKEKSMKKCQK